MNKVLVGIFIGMTIGMFSGAFIVCSLDKAIVRDQLVEKNLGKYIVNPTNGVTSFESPISFAK